MLNIAVGSVIIGYAGYALFQSVKTSRKGKCQACSVQSTCSQKACEVDWIETFAQTKHATK